MNRTYVERIQDMLDNCTKAMRFVQGVSYNEFILDEEKIYAVVHAIEIIGEAARHVPDKVREAYPAVPWKQAAGMRDRLAHGYFGLDYAIIWQTLRDDLPPLRRALENTLSDLRNKS